MKIIFWSAAIALGLTGSAYAQRNTATIIGTVRDSSGGIIFEASVRAVNKATGVDYPTLNVDQRPNLDVVLQVGSVSESITVDASAPMIEATHANIGAVVDKVNVQQLPLNGRQFLQLALLLPGISPAAGGQTVARGGGPRNVGFQGGGNRATNNTFLVDGIRSASASRIRACGRRCRRSRNSRSWSRPTTLSTALPQGFTSVSSPAAGPTSSTVNFSSISGTISWTPATFSTGRSRPIDKTSSAAPLEDL